MEFLYYLLISLLGWCGRIIFTPFVLFPLLDLCAEEGSYEIIKKWFNPLYSFERRNA